MYRCAAPRRSCPSKPAYKPRNRLALVGWAKRCVPTIPATALDGGHVASAPLPTLRASTIRTALPPTRYAMLASERRKALESPHGHADQPLHRTARAGSGDLL